MANPPGVTPNPQPEDPKHHEHYLPDDQWGQVVRDAQKFRAESDESETD